MTGLQGLSPQVHSYWPHLRPGRHSGKLGLTGRPLLQIRGG
jgi:hypothetical protein